MGKTKTIKTLIILYLLLFPLGQLTRFQLNLFGVQVPFYINDFIVGLTSIIWIVSNYKNKGIIPPSFKSFFEISLFSFLISIFIFHTPSLAFGLLYLIRLFSYLIFFLAVRHVVKINNKIKGTLFNLLIYASLLTAIFGWLQYLIIPDTRFLKAYGWDDHLYRLIGTFLDPTFTGIIIVFGFLLTLGKFLSSKKPSWLITSIFMLISVGFTYSRASFLALLVGASVILFVYKKISRLFILVPLFALLVLFLPRPSSEGVQLERTKSIFSRFTSYDATIQIFKKSPVFGVGYDNFCLARGLIGGDVNFNSHSCSGSDSSVLLILSTLGVVGTMIFIVLVIYIFKNLGGEYYQETIAILFAIMIHSIFSNSLFYPWVMGFLVVLLGISTRRQEE